MAKAAVISEQGMRSSMEDAHQLLRDLHQSGDMFCGVYDGHSGSYAAEYAADTLHLRFASALQQGLDPEEAFVRAYEQVSQELSHQTSGTTAVTLYLRDGELVAANAGDARLVVVDSGSVRQITRDHRVEDPGERERIESCGGIISGPYVLCGGGGLMPTRSLGDEYFKPVGIIATPDTATERLGEDDRWLVVACDGLFDVMDNQEVAAIVNQTDSAREAADALRQEALVHRMGTDNLTVVVVDLTR
ncbi:MAG: protein phosphatase 2C domain-containing protein [Desulfohalobiaceae bacterium]|nr:protein phosphatase 2C domain-containing protein [Desulfohalobiaceae bacterium]